MRQVDNRGEGRDVLLAALQGDLHLVLADGALQPEDDLLSGLGLNAQRFPMSELISHNQGEDSTDLLVEDGLGLTTITGLLAVITTLSLGGERVLALLVLGDLVGAKTL